MAPTTRRRNGVVRKVTVRQPIPKDVLVELSPKHDKKCMFCGRKEISEKLYGILYQLNDVVVHYFCILLSSRAVQNGADKEGIWGFLLKDIKAELTRGSREECFYCKKKGATISCCEVKCRKIFHLPCGLQNGSMHQYFQTFKSFCLHHRITQAIDIQELQNSDPVQCAICKEDVIPTPIPSSLWAPCCKRAAWFHRDCIQDLALSAGYFFKCPLCNNTDVFKSRMLTLGIYIPSRKSIKKLNNRDASWETVPNAYAELLERHSTCDADNCMCPHYNQRRYQQNSGSWEIILCHTCGSNGTHKLCSSLKCDQQWFCTACKNIAEGTVTHKRRRVEITSTVVHSNSVSTVHEEILSQDISSRGGNVFEVSRNIETRESARLNNNNKDSIIHSESQHNIPTPQMLGTIVISDDSDSDSDSDLQMISYVDPPKLAITTQIGLPVISGYSSMSTSMPILNAFHQHSFSTAPHSTNYNCTLASSNICTLNIRRQSRQTYIDLTTDEDEHSS